MIWRDIRFEKPTEKDAASCGRILQVLNCGAVGLYSWRHLVATIAWMPLSELPQPDLPGPIPDGWRPVDKAVDKKRTDEMFWLNGAWRPTSRDDTWDSDTHYIVPIEPPAPQYRPFASAAEFMPHRARWVKHKLPDFSSAIMSCTDSTVWLGSATIGTSYRDMFEDFTFADDGTPFGVLVTEATQ